MARVGHGDNQTIAIGRTGLSITTTFDGFFAGSKQPDFGYMFTQSPTERPSEADRLPDSPTMLDDLERLADAMGAGEASEPDPTTDLAAQGDHSIPAGYTYLGQFIDHDITATAGAPDITGDPFEPMESLASVRNARTPFLELDSVYGKLGAADNQVPPPIGARMVVGQVTNVGGDNFGTTPFLKIPGKGLSNDLPRKPRSSNKAIDREALIGDPRNDENLIVQQLHTAFLKAHNTLADQLGSFVAAREALIRMYQSVIVDDFLPRVCDAATLANVLTEGPRFFTPTGPLFMPVEFSAAAYRFGHSMVRREYDFNVNFSPARSAFLFTFTALSGNLNFAPADPDNSPELAGSDTFPHNWVISWERFVPLGGVNPQRARSIDPLLTPILAELRDTLGNKMEGNIAPHLAKRNLRRGYLLGLPTGQAVAARLGLTPITIDAASTGLAEAAVAPFASRTPLWLYVLTEAKLNGGKLGAVGTTILAETFVTLIRRSKPSIFDSHGARVSSARHKLADIIKLADVQDTPVVSG